MYYYGGLNVHFPNYGEIENILICLLAIWIYSFSYWLFIYYKYSSTCLKDLRTSFKKESKLQKNRYRETHMYVCTNICTIYLYLC